MIRSIAQLPFRRREPLELLRLDEARRTEVDPDYTGFGHSRVEALTLVGRDGRCVRVPDALVLALHCTDPGEPLGDDIELEFVLDELAPGLSVSAPLSRFLDVWLPSLCGDAAAVVLALCNPHRAELTRPAVLSGTDVRLYYGLGDVESWYHDDGVRLVAEAWRAARDR